MKYSNLLFLSLILFLVACQKNLDKLETETKTTVSETTILDGVTWRAVVKEPETLKHYEDFSVGLHNVSVKLMSRGAIIEQTNTDETGTFELSAELVPSDAYVLFESAGFHNAVVRVDDEFMGWEMYMIPETQLGITQETHSTKEPHIALRGRIHEAFNGNDLWCYVTNANDELVGTVTRLSDFDNFYITTLPDEELFFHYSYECFPGNVIPLGSFSEDTDLGTLLDNFQEVPYERGRILFNKVNDCAGNKILGTDLYHKVNGLTKTGFGNTIVDIQECYLPQQILLTATSQNPRKYQEMLVNLDAGVGAIIPEINLCEDDDTFVRYSIGGNDTQANIFTFANVLPDGRLVVKQAALDLINETSLSFVSGSASVGNSKGDALIYVLRDASFGGNGLDFNITMMDGEFIEGTINGEIFDTEEQSQGVLDASFRARIQ